MGAAPSSDLPNRLVHDSTHDGRLLNRRGNDSSRRDLNTDVDVVTPPGPPIAAVPTNRVLILPARPSVVFLNQISGRKMGVFTILPNLSCLGSGMRKTNMKAGIRTCSGNSKVCIESQRRLRGRYSTKVAEYGHGRKGHHHFIVSV